jgi:protein-disulfide isomerase
MFSFIADKKMPIIGIMLVLGFIILAIQPKSDMTNSFTIVSMDSPMARGDKDAPVSLIQYSDFLCPSCAYFSTQIMPVIEEKYIKTGKVKFEFRPMAFIADGSNQSGMGGYCAIDQDKFWAYHDGVYKVVADKVFNQKLDPKTDIILTANDVKVISSGVGLDSKTFNDCLDSNTKSSSIINSTKAANRNGVTGTPYIMINGQQYQGDMSLTSIEALIKAQL